MIIRREQDEQHGTILSVLSRVQAFGATECNTEFNIE